MRIDTPRSDTGDALVYAVGDVHGCYDLLTAMLRRIKDDAQEHARGRRPILVMLGDYVDRGPHAARVMTALARLARHGEYELHLLMGNHEAWFLDFIDAPEEAADWLRFGGRETLASYGVVPPEEDAAQDLVRARDDLLERMPVAHLSLLRQLEMMAVVGDYAFVHAGIRPGTPLDEQARDDLLWIREPFLGSDARFDKRIVHGHSWAGVEVTPRPNRIALDTGAYETGVLSAVRLDGLTCEVLQVR